MQIPKHYPTPSVLVHWLTAALILAALPLGLYMSELPLSPYKLKLISYHKWIGITALLLFLPRVLVRLTRPVPPPLEGPAWQRLAASATHLLLYVLIVAVPLTGWLMSSAKGFPVVYLGILPLPDLLPKDQALGDLFKTVHETLNTGLLMLIGLHVAAALKHQFIDRDGTLVRMMPILKRSN